MMSEVGSINAIYWDLEFEWKINDIHRIMDSTKVGDFLQSPKFTLNYNSNIEWYLRLFPNGKTNDCKEYLSLFAYSTVKIEADVAFAIFNKKGKKMLYLTLKENLFGKKGYGLHKLISRSSVEDSQNGILDNDKLVIVCKIKYQNTDAELSLRSHHNKEKRQKVEHDLPPRLSDYYEALLDDDKFSDVSLVSEGKPIKAHKVILAKRSAVFAAMFSNEMREKQENIIEIDDIKYDVLMEMLRFIYAGKANNIDTFASELAVAADKYALDDLKPMCEKSMIKNLSPDNVIAYLQVADRLFMNKLKKNAIEFIIEKAIDITKKPEFNLLPFNLISDILSRCLSKNVK